MGLKYKIRAAIAGMTTAQKIVTVAIAVMIPLGVWMGMGFPIDATSLGQLAAEEVTALVAAFGIIFGVTPPS